MACDKRELESFNEKKNAKEREVASMKGEKVNEAYDEMLKNYFECAILIKSKPKKADPE